MLVILLAGDVVMGTFVIVEETVIFRCVENSSYCNVLMIFSLSFRIIFVGIFIFSDRR